MQKFGGYLYHADTAWAPKFRTFRSEGDPNMLLLRQCTLWSGLLIRACFFRRETTWTHVLTWILEKTNFSQNCICYDTILHAIFLAILINESMAESEEQAMSINCPNSQKLLRPPSRGHKSRMWSRLMRIHL